MKGQWAVPIIASILILGTILMISPLTTMQQAYAQTCTPPPAGLVSWWPGDGNANDIVGNNPGTLVGDTTFISGKVDQAFSFDGNGDFVSVPDDNSLDLGTGDFSIDAWIKTDSTRTVNTIMDKRVDNRSTGGPITGYHFFLFTSSGRLGVQMADGGFTNFISSTSVRDGEFHHVAVTVDRDSATGGKLYVDGTTVLTFVPTSRSGSLDNNADFLIGGHMDFPGGVFDGEIDELELYNRALSQSEIQAIFNAGIAGKCKVLDTTPSVPVGGELIPLDSTALLLAGTYSSAAWMIPVIVSGIGFAIVIARKF